MALSAVPPAPAPAPTAPPAGFIVDLDGFEGPIDLLLSLARDQKVDLAKIYDFGVFQLVDFELDRNGEDLDLIITANEKFHSPNIINFGLSYQGGEGGKSDIEARMRLTRMEMNRFGAELRTDLQIGVKNFIRMEFYQPLTWARRPFFALTGLLESNIHDWYFQLRRWGQYKTIQQSIKPEVGFRIGHYGEIRAGLDYGYLKASDRTGLSLAEFNGPRGGYVARLNFDMFDLPVLPRRGFKARVDYFEGRPEFGSGLDYSRLEGGISTAHSFGRHTILTGLGGGSNLNTHLPEFHMFTLGGIGRLSGYSKDQLRGQAYGLGRLAWYHQFAGSPSPYSTSYYIGMQFEAGNTWYDPSHARWDDLRYSGLISLVAMTNLGPLAASYGRSEDGHDNYYLTLGTLKDFLD
jgi:NTE family protein